MSEMHWRDLKETDFGALKSLAGQWDAYINDMVAQAEIITEDVVKKHLGTENFDSATADDVRRQADLLADSIQDDLHEYAMVKIRATLEDAHVELTECQAQLFDLIEAVTGEYRFEGGSGDPHVVVSDGHYERIAALEATAALMERAGVKESDFASDFGQNESRQRLIAAAETVAGELTEVLKAIMTRAHNADDDAAAILKSIIDTPAEQPPPIGATYDDLIDGYEEADAERHAEFLQELASGDSEATATGVNDWWNGLTDDERADLIGSHPGLIGGLDGIPSATRNDVNQNLLTTEIDTTGARISEVQTRLDQMLADGSSTTNAEEYRNLQLELGELQTQYDNATALQAALNAGSDSGEPLLLIDFDTSNDGTAVVSVGDPDTAHHTAVYVPGTTSDLGGIGGLVGDASTLQADAERFGIDGEKTAVVMWLDYDAPDNAVPVTQDGPFAPEAWRDDQALDSRSGLNSFLEGVDAAHGGDAHTTLIGHSYGTVATGATAAEYQIAADQIIDIASPGLMVGTAEELSVGGDDVWSTRAEDDVIELAVGTGAMGADPTSTEFGGNVFDAEAIGDSGTKIHSGYLKDNAEGDENPARLTMAEIITGQRG
ncbi:alpha/beta hydrolase [Glycomyces harbinensis]|uniref:Alpha/beta hydrolase n=1 Tax=Glycomyces harbinensis TaxID=58114 RepID=A0A1G7CWL7_9ACTN|nr:alpha/beta hydrolase [Glycomyces harbinensis]SDE43641.1 Alpha/beta hydrolase [Glycomyces harbinensis]